MVKKSNIRFAQLRAFFEGMGFSATREKKGWKAQCLNPTIMNGQATSSCASVWKGLEIIEGLRGHVSGLGVPTYVVDGLHGAGKIPLMPNYLVSASENAVILRNYEGLLFRYAPEDKDGGEQSHYSSMGVSGLLGGQGGALIPVGNRRMARREEHSDDSLSLRERAGVRAAETNGNGHHNGNGHAKVNGNGHTKLNGNGHANGNGKPYGTLPIIDRLS